MPRFHPALLAAAALTLWAAAVEAQPSFDARLGLGLDTWRAGATTENKLAFSGTFAPEVLFADERGRAWYALDAGNADASGDWTSVHHALGARWRFDLGSDAVQAFVGGGLDLQRNGDAWQDADYDGAHAFFNLVGRRVGPLTLRGGVRLARRSFAGLPALDQDEAEGFAAALFNFESKTTVIAELRYGGKRWEGQPAFHVPASSTFAPSGSSGMGGRGAGRGIGGTGVMVPATPEAIVPAIPAADARQWTAMLRLAQGLGEKAGVHVQWLQRGLDGDPAPLRLETPAGYFDDGVLDDPYASELLAVQAGLSRNWGDATSLRLTGEWRRRDFPAAGFADAAVPARQDRVWRGLARLSLPLLAEKTGDFALGLSLDYAYTDSASDDAFYDYRHHAAGVSLTLSR